MNIEKTKVYKLFRISDGKEVYSSPFYDDKKKVAKMLQFYIDRVNSGIEQQLNSLKTPENIKVGLKFLNDRDFKVEIWEFWNEGGWVERKISDCGNFEEFLGV